MRVAPDTGPSAAPKKPRAEARGWAWWRDERRAGGRPVSPRSRSGLPGGGADSTVPKSPERKRGVGSGGGPGVALPATIRRSAWLILAIADIRDHGLERPLTKHESCAAALRPPPDSPLVGMLNRAIQRPRAPCLELAGHRFRVRIGRRHDDMYMRRAALDRMEDPAPVSAVLSDAADDRVALVVRECDRRGGKTNLITQ